MYCSNKSKRLAIDTASQDRNQNLLPGGQALAKGVQANIEKYLRI